MTSFDIPFVSYAWCKHKIEADSFAEALALVVARQQQLVHHSFTATLTDAQGQPFKATMQLYGKIHFPFEEIVENGQQAGIQASEAAQLNQQLTLMPRS